MPIYNQDTGGAGGSSDIVGQVIEAPSAPTSDYLELDGGVHSAGDYPDLAALPGYPGADGAISAVVDAEGDSGLVSDVVAQSAFVKVVSSGTDFYVLLSDNTLHKSVDNGATWVLVKTFTVVPRSMSVNSVNLVVIQDSATFTTIRLLDDVILQDEVSLTSPFGTIGRFSTWDSINSQFIVGSYATSAETRVYSSPDGITWSVEQTIAGTIGQCVSTSYGFLFFSFTSGDIQYSQFLPTAPVSLYTSAADADGYQLTSYGDFVAFYSVTAGNPTHLVTSNDGGETFVSSLITGGTLLATGQIIHGGNGSWLISTGGTSGVQLTTDRGVTYDSVDLTTYHSGAVNSGGDIVLIGAVGGSKVAQMHFTYPALPTFSVPLVPPTAYSKFFVKGV